MIFLDRGTCNCVLPTAEVSFLQVRCNNAFFQLTDNDSNQLTFYVASTVSVTQYGSVRCDSMQFCTHCSMHKQYQGPQSPVEFLPKTRNSRKHQGAECQHPKRMWRTHTNIYRQSRPIIIYLFTIFNSHVMIIPCIDNGMAQLIVLLRFVHSCQTIPPFVLICSEDNRSREIVLGL